MRKTFTSLFVCVMIMIITAFMLPAISSPSYALPKCNYKHNAFMGSDCYARGSQKAAVIDYIMSRWNCEQHVKGPGMLCNVWATRAFNSVAKTSSRRGCYCRFTKKNLLRICKGVKPGTKIIIGTRHRQVHAIILFKVTDKKVYWGDCNWTHDNNVHYRSSTPKDFINFSHYKKSKYTHFHTIWKVKSYKRCTTPKLHVSNTTKSGAIRINWTKTPKAKEYRVYRATSKKGKYERLDVTRYTDYTDTSAKMGKKYYYKVRVIKKNGKKYTSNIVSSRTRLDRPSIWLTFEKSGKATLHWSKVEGATKYIVYRHKGYTGKWKIIKKTTKTSFHNAKLKKTKSKSTLYWYRVRAVNGKKSQESLASVVITPCRYARVP